MSKGKNNKNNKKVNVPQTKDKDVEEKSTEEKSTEPEIESKEETLPPQSALLAIPIHGYAAI